MTGNGRSGTTVISETFDFIPMLAAAPSEARPRSAVIWLPGFGGTKEQMMPQLLELAAEGYVAVSFDPVQHGARSLETSQQLALRVTGNLRRYFWPILAHTAEEFPRVIDRIMERWPSIETVMAGGISMGGDIAVAAAGLDDRIRAVAACIATPDWRRPGSHEPPGAADRYAKACRERTEPFSNLERYASHIPAIRFLCGARDTQVPPDGAIRFVSALRRGAYRSVPNRLDVTLFGHVNHRFTERMWALSVDWFASFRL